MINKRLGVGKDSRMFQLFLTEGENECLVSREVRVLDVINQMKESMYLQFAVAYYYPFDLFNKRVVELVFCQCIHDIQLGKYFHKEEDYFSCIALILQHTLQDYSGDNRLLWYRFLDIIIVVKKSKTYSRVFC